MTDYRAFVEDAPQREDIDFLERQINGHNMAATARAGGELLAVFLREENGEIFGGLYGWTWASWLEVRYLWVRSDRQSSGAPAWTQSGTLSGMTSARTSVMFQTPPAREPMATSSPCVP